LTNKDSSKSGKFLFKLIKIKSNEELKAIDEKAEDLIESSSKELSPLNNHKKSFEFAKDILQKNENEHEDISNLEKQNIHAEIFKKDRHIEIL
jgi:hypothetical protein